MQQYSPLLLSLGETMLNLYFALRAVECLCALSLLIQTLEFFRLQPALQETGIWCWNKQRQELSHSPIWMQKLADFLYQEHHHRLHLMLRAATAVTLFFGISLVSSVFLFFSTIILLIRWRGAFNGGSDFMTLVVVTGLLITQLGIPLLGAPMAYRAGLWFITIQAISSYFISGSVKLFDANWRNGRALSFFISGAIFGPLQENSIYKKRWFALMSCWSFIVWESTFPLALCGPLWAVTWCSIAALFHFLVFWHFGLNRFFWAWLSTFPAIIYCSTELRFF